jgi:hypothetical protein
VFLELKGIFIIKKKFKICEKPQKKRRLENRKIGK